MLLVTRRVSQLRKLWSCEGTKYFIFSTSSNTRWTSSSPQPGQLEVYQDTVGRLNAAIAFKANDQDSRDTARLVETGAKKLTQLCTKRVAEGSSPSSPIGGLDFTPQSSPPDLLSSIQPLIVFLRTLPTPATHPSHPAASAI